MNICLVAYFVVCIPSFGCCC